METKIKRDHVVSLFVSSIIVYLVSFISPSQLVADSQVPDFYYYYTEKIYLDVSTEMIAICFEETISKERKEALIEDDPTLDHISDEKLAPRLVLIATKQGLCRDEIRQAVGRLNKLQEVKYCTPVFQFRNMKIILRDEFVVRFKTDVTEEDIEILNKENGVGVVRRSPYRHNRYVLRVMNPKDRDALEMANIYNENPKVQYSSPNFGIIGAYLNTYPDDTYGPKPAPDGGE